MISVRLEPYGQVTSVRLQQRDGPEIELAIAPRDWAAEPHDPGTWAVATNGLLVLLDRDGGLVKLCDAAGHGAPRATPSPWNDPDRLDP